MDISLLERPEFIQTDKGYWNLLYRGHKYTLLQQDGSIKKWRCTKRAYRGCRVTLQTQNQDVVVMYNEHNHPPHKAFIQTAVFMSSKTGHQQIHMDGYRYSFHCENRGRGRWRCVKQRTGCKAIVVTYNGDIQFIKNIHNHLPDMPHAYYR